MLKLIFLHIYNLFENQILNVMLNNDKYWKDYYKAKNIKLRKKS